MDGTVRLWRLSQQNCSFPHVVILPHIRGNQMALEVKDIGCNQYALIASLASDGIPRLWSSEGVLFNTIQHVSEILTVEWDNSGMYILAAYESGLSVWDSQGILIKDLASKYIQAVKSALWRSPTEFTVLSLSGVWAWRQGEDPVNIFDEEVQTVKWSPNKNFLAIVQGLQIGIYQDEYDMWWITGEASALQFTSKDFVIAIGTPTGEVYMWDLEKRGIISRLVTSIGPICRLAFRKDDEFLAACSDFDVQIWYMDNVNYMRKLKIQSKINDMIWSDEANKLAIAYLDKIAVYSL